MLLKNVYNKLVGKVNVINNSRLISKTQNNTDKFSTLKIVILIRDPDKILYRFSTY